MACILWLEGIVAGEEECRRLSEMLREKVEEVGDLKQSSYVMKENLSVLQKQVQGQCLFACL